ncbi:MAG: hypothetical protein JSR45_01220 [Proteobacteria bacterium]|nr:hypothetical protein [Pseudomonadota bacterium]
MADDGGPVWARSKRSGGGAGGILVFLMFMLALFGVLMLVLAGMNQWHFGKAGAQIDNWICTVMGKAKAGKPAAAPAPVAVTAPAPASNPAPAASAPSAKPAAKK